MIHVMAGIIFRQGKILIAQRKKDKERALLWELPGGKAIRNEPFEDCLKRELSEEFGVNVSIGEQFMSNHHIYPDMELTLHAYFVTITSGEPQLYVHRNIEWINVEDYTKYKIAEADLPIMKELTLYN